MVEVTRCPRRALLPSLEGRGWGWVGPLFERLDRQVAFTVPVSQEAGPAFPHTTGPPAAASTRHFALPVTVTVPSPLFVT